jgi:hypothetical protein
MGNFKDLFNALFKGEKAMKDKTNEVRDAISDEAGPHRMAQAVVNRARDQFPKTWRNAAITQLAAVMSIPRQEACMWVAEHCELPMVSEPGPFKKD